MPYLFEELAPHHRVAVIDIFNFYILHTMAAYPDEPISYDSFDHLLEMSKGYPSVVVQDHAGPVVGFALMRSHQPLRTFRRAAEVSYFILPAHTRRGIGAGILAYFVAEARKLAIDSLLASISSHNTLSLAFHRKRGFEECGRFRRVGRKFGEDFDVIWMQLFV
jgi:L-amino acid N-acyltransferase YncA